MQSRRSAPATGGTQSSGAPADPHWVEAAEPAYWWADHLIALADGRALALTTTRPLQQPFSLDLAPEVTEIYDPTRNEWHEAEALNKPRARDVAVRLSDGRVLVAGGLNEDRQSFSSTYLFDPATETWSKSGLLGTARTGAVGAALADGRALVAGGYFQNGPNPIEGGATNAIPAVFHADLMDIDVPPFATAMATAEVFDPATGTWSATGPMSYARNGASAVALADGRILVVGSKDSQSGVAVDDHATDTAEIYDPSTGRFSLAGTLPPVDLAALEAAGGPPVQDLSQYTPSPEAGTLVALPDGGALIVGRDEYWKHQGDVARSFRYDPTQNTWSEVGDIWFVFDDNVPTPLIAEGVADLRGSMVAGLHDGRVLVAGGRTPSVAATGDDGGRTQSEISDAARFYDPSSGGLSDAPTMPDPRIGAAVALLEDGSVLVMGGEDADGTESGPSPAAMRLVP